MLCRIVFAPEAQSNLSPPASRPSGIFGAPCLRMLAALCLLIVTGLIGACGESSRAISIVGPTPPTLTSITVTPANATIKTGSTQQFIATGLYSDGSGQNITATVAWNSSSPTVATIGANTGGLATAVAAGTTTITATLSGISSATTLNVTSATLLSISVTPATATLVAGTTQQFVATGIYSDNTKQVLTTVASWHGVNPAVATVSNAPGSQGLATAVGAGSTSITASYGGVIGTATLTVSPATLVSIAVTPANGTVAKGSTEALIATATYSDGSKQNVTTTATWASGDTTVATVAAVTVPAPGELATAVAPGTTTLTATLGAVSGTTNITVTAATLVSIAVTPAAPSIANGLTLQFTATGTYTDGSTQDLTATAAWNSSAPGIASIAAGGLSSTHSVGSTTITAAVGGVTSANDTLTVTAATLVSIAITPSSPAPTIDFGGTQAFTAIGNYTDGTMPDITATVVWNSATSATATISNATPTNGVASAVALGTTVITAALGSVTSNAVTLTVAGGFAYAANFGGSVSQFAIGADGLLTKLAADVPAGSGAYSITIDASRKFAYVANYTPHLPPIPGSLSEFSIGADHTLTAIGQITTVDGPNGVAAHPSLPYLYVAYYDASLVEWYSIGATGQLTLLNQITAGSKPASIALTPSGNYAYVANYNSAGVSQFVVHPDGSLTSIAADIGAGTNPNFVVVDPSGRFVYVANYGSGNVSQYSIGGGGVLTPIGTGIVASGGAGSWSVTVDALGQNAYVPNRTGNSVSHFTIDSSGALTLHDTLSLPGTGPTSVAIDLSGQFAFVADRAGTTITQCAIQPDGSLIVGPTPTVNAGTNPADIITAR